MAVVPVQSVGNSSELKDVGSKNSASPTAGRWIFNPWVDGLFIILTPVVVAPAVMILCSSSELMSAETLSLIVTAFFATGHHLPGLIRAYGDRELFERFRWRFLLAPPIVFLAYFPLYSHHYNLYRLIILTWATWHGLMQLYGFMRIYDAKAGSVSSTTSYWDWLVCLCGFITPQLFRQEHVATNLGHWYSAGGPWISPFVLQSARWGSLLLTGVALAGFTVNYVLQSVQGKRPSSVKLLMLVSGIGMWCFIMLSVENLLIGVALFDICHDVQYLAIVWLFNCRRVQSNVNLGRFMTFVFRRGMLLLYLGLITAYGAIAFAGSLVLDGTLSQIFYGILFTSTILHYYYDGFIWKVREATNRSGLGLNSTGLPARFQQAASDGTLHLLKWSPVLVGLGVLFSTDFLAPDLTTTQKTDLERIYCHSLTGKSALPRGKQEQSWLYSHFEQTLAIASLLPDDVKSQKRAAIMLANFGRNEEAVDLLKKTLQQHPKSSEAHLILGGIHLYRGDHGQALDSLQAALAHAANRQERAAANVKLGELCLRQNHSEKADEHFRAALRDNPELQDAIAQMRKTL